MTENRSVFVNLSNHPSDKWSRPQIEAALAMGQEIVDIPFPPVPANADEAEIVLMGKECFDKVMEVAAGREVTVHVAGEFTLTVNIVERCKSAGIACVASCTERIAVEMPNGEILKRFEFTKFRRY